MADAATGAGRPARYRRIRSVLSAAGTCAAASALSGITDKGSHEPLSPATLRVWNRDMTELSSVLVGDAPLSHADVVAVARHGAPVAISPAALARVADTRRVIDGLAADPNPHYGVSTGFGALATTFIAPDRRLQLQASLIRSHAAGTGAEVEREVVRGLQLLRLQTLTSGRTGVRPVVVETYAGLLNAGITPVVREYGSLGCSGDLAPLAHIALAAMGEGDVRAADGELVAASAALSAAGIEPLTLVEKEGLALINGTDGMLGMLVLALHDLETLLLTADMAAAMSVESQMGTDAVFAADLMACLLYTSPSPRDLSTSRMPSSA